MSLNPPSSSNLLTSLITVHDKDDPKKYVTFGRPRAEITEETKQEGEYSEATSTVPFQRRTAVIVFNDSEGKEIAVSVSLETLRCIAEMINY